LRVVGPVIQFPVDQQPHAEDLAVDAHSRALQVEQVLPAGASRGHGLSKPSSTIHIHPAPPNSSRVATDASRIVVAADRRVKTTSPLSDGLKGVFHADWHRLLPLTVFEPCRAT
ncbi:MAG: hypothetical protein QGG71_17660, partial [Pirellulaceae bacterium]|nr:hypothetical protein [Pirellulaceae bacterium]